MFLHDNVYLMTKEVNGEMFNRKRVRYSMLVCFVLCSLFFLHNAHANPQLVVPDQQFDAGRVKEGEIVTHRYTVRNQGDQDLHIQQVKPDCGCTSAEFDRSIAPGKEGHITLRLDTHGYRGKIAKYTRVFTNAPRHKRIVLTMEADVWTPIRLSKNYVIFKGTAGEKISDAIDVRSEMDKPLKVEAENFDLKGKVEYRIEEMEEGQSFRIHFSSLPGPAQHYHGTLRLRTNFPEKPEIEIRIRARFREKS